MSYRTPLTEDERATLWPSRPRRRRSHAAPAPTQVVKRLPDRTSTITLGQHPVRSKQSGEMVSADDAIIEGIVDRALNKARFCDVVELYRLLDAEEDAEIARPDSYVSPYRKRKMIESIKSALLAYARQIEKLRATGLIVAKREPDILYRVSIAPMVAERIDARRRGWR